MLNESDYEFQEEAMSDKPLSSGDIKGGHLKLLRHAVITSEGAPVDIDDARTDQDACDAVVDCIHDTLTSQELPIRIRTSA